MNNRIFGVVALLGLLVLWLSERPARASLPRKLTASWYGAEAAGKPTASGEIFDPRKFTAASWEFFGKTLRVSHGGKSVVVIVNDKGPARRLLRTRQLDLSRAAFLALAPLEKGLIAVTVEVLP